MQVSRIKALALLLVAVTVFSSLSVLGSRDNSDKELTAAVEMNTVEIQSNRYTKTTPDTPAENRLSLEGYEKMLENNALEIWFSSDIDAVRIVDKANGYVWGGLPEEKGKDLNTGWSNFANSLCSIEYFNSNGSESRLSISDNNVKSFYEWTDDGMLCTFNANKAGIVFDFEMKLEENAVTFSVVEDSLQENGDAKLKALYFVPFLGSAYQDEINGYMFIPDGCGALMRFSKSSSYVTGFDSKVYGIDGSIDSLAPAGTLQANRINEYLVDPNKITMPVFGVAHGNEQNAFLGVIGGGSEYSSVTASPAGVVTDYNWVSARFNYRQMYTQTISGSGIPVVQEKANKMVPSVTYYFLNGKEATYSGMATAYREQLIESGELAVERKDEDIPFRLEIVGATVKKGFLFNSVKTLTTADEGIDIIERLNKGGISNLTVVYRGWQKGAIEKSDYGTYKAGGNIGGKSGLSELLEKTASLDSRLYLYMEPMLANEEQIYKSSDAAIGIEQSFISKTAANTDQLYPTEFFAKISRMLDVTAKGFGDYSMAIDSIGNTLYADYSKKKEYTRDETLEGIIEVLAKRENNALYNPNSYCWQYTTEFFDIPVNNSQYQYETDTVPFLQMVLKGSIDYYSTFANQGYCSQSSILKMVEYGVYPSFITMAADNYQLSNTAMSDYFSLCFEDWEDNMVSIYEQVNNALSKVEGSSITEHKMLLDGVVRVTYSNGTVIYVNYLSEEVTVDGVTVGAQQYSVIS